MDGRKEGIPLSFLRGGGYMGDGGFLYGGGSEGYYWESKVNSNTRAQYLSFHSADLDSWHNYYKVRGYPIRCVVKP